MEDEKFNALLEEIKKLRENKNVQYGNSFIRTYNRFGMIGIRADLGRKWDRLEVFMEKYGANPNIPDEDKSIIRDTLIDMAVMSLNAILWIDDINKKNE